MLTLFVPGPPQGKGRARSTTVNGKTFHYTPDKTRTYEGMIRTQAIEEMGIRAVTTQPIALKLVINYPIPVSWPKWKLQAAFDGEIVPTTKPDADNVVKAIKDALNGVVWKDDCQVTQMEVSKIYSESPGVLVEVVRLNQHPAQIKRKSEAA